MIKLKNVNYKNNNTYILKNVNYQFDKKTFYTIFGKSGSGKSSLLKSIVNLINFTGEITFFDKNILDLPPQKLRSKILYLHQEPLLFGYRVIDDIKTIYNLKIHKGKKFDINFYLELLKNFGYDKSFLEKPIKELSGGQKQIAAILRAITLKPDFLLLDEPTSALDINSEQILIDLLNNIKKEIGIISISHSINLITNSDIQVLISNGTILSDYKKINETEIKKVLNE